MIKGFVLGSIVILILAVGVGISAWITKLAWEWVVPDIFAGMVGAGLLPAALTWAQAFKLAICNVVLGLGFFAVSR